MATPVIMPKAGNSVESCIIIVWHKKVGDAIKEGDVLCEIETDKSTLEVESPASGTLLEIFFEAEEDVPVQINIAAIGDAGEDASSLKPSIEKEETPAETVEEKPAEITAAPTTNAPIATNSDSNFISPRARNLAAQKGLDASNIAGTGPDGRIIERDVIAAEATAPRLSSLAQSVLSGGNLAAPTIGSGVGGMVLAGDLSEKQAVPTQKTIAPKEDTVIPVKGIRKVIASRMMNSLSTTAQLTLTSTCKATALQRFRSLVKENAELYNLPNVTINDMILFAVSRVLKRHPELNAHFLGDKIIQFGAVNIGVAVDTERGLMVPVLKDADSLSLGEISQTFKPLAKECLAGTVNPDNLQGGTFTVTNLGQLGIEQFTPVLNAPEVAILGVGCITLKPYQGKTEVEFIPSLSLSLTMDHQATDGAPGARFLQDLCKTIESFELLAAL